MKSNTSTSLFDNIDSSNSSSEPDNYYEKPTIASLFGNLHLHSTKTEECKKEEPKNIMDEVRNVKPVTSKDSENKLDSHANFNFSDISSVLKDCSSSTINLESKEFLEISLKSNISSTSDQNKISKNEKLSLGTSNETIILDKNKNLCTPLHSRIPILHTRSDPSDFSSSDTNTFLLSGVKLINENNLRRICSNTKIPIRNINSTKICSEASIQNSRSKFNKTPNVNSISLNNQTYLSKKNKYSHIKSKLADYIHKPPKSKQLNSVNYNIKSTRNQEKSKNATSPLFADNLSLNYLNQNYNSRSSLDVYSYDCKLQPNLSCNSESKKSEAVPINYEKACEHFELALRHNEIKMENEKVILDYQRSILRHQQLVLRHKEQINDHIFKTLSHLLHKVT